MPWLGALECAACGVLCAWLQCAECAVVMCCVFSAFVTAVLGLIRYGTCKEHAEITLDSNMLRACVLRTILSGGQTAPAACHSAMVCMQYCAPVVCAAPACMEC